MMKKPGASHRGSPERFPIFNPGFFLVLFLLAVAVAGFGTADFAISVVAVFTAFGVALVGAWLGICQWSRLGAGQRLATAILVVLIATVSLRLVVRGLWDGLVHAFL